VSAPHAQPPVPPVDFLALGSLTSSWVLPTERARGYAIRLHETSGGAGVATLRLPSTPVTVRLVNAIGRELGRPSADADFVIPYGACQVVSVLVEVEA
jgi:hypothetical protein